MHCVMPLLSTVGGSGTIRHPVLRGQTPGARMQGSSGTVDPSSQQVRPSAERSRVISVADSAGALGTERADRGDVAASGLCPRPVHALPARPPPAEEQRPAPGLRHDHPSLSGNLYPYVRHTFTLDLQTKSRAAFCALEQLISPHHDATLRGQPMPPPLHFAVGTPPRSGTRGCSTDQAGSSGARPALAAGSARWR